MMRFLMWVAILSVVPLLLIGNIWHAVGALFSAFICWLDSKGYLSGSGGTSSRLATPEEVAEDFYAARREGRDLKSHAQLIAERRRGG